MKKTVQKIVRAAGFVFMACALTALVSCSDGTSSKKDEEKEEEIEDTTDNTNALCMVGTTWTANKTVDTATEITDFGKGAYLVYATPITSSSSIQMTAHIKFSSITDTATGNGLQNGGIGVVEVSGSEAISTTVGYASEVGVKSSTSGGTLLYSGGQGYTKNGTAAVNTEYVASVKVTSGKWTISYYDAAGKNILWTKNYSWASFYPDTSTVYLAIGGADTSTVTYWNVQVTDLDSDSTNKITALKYNALAGLTLSVDDESVTALTLSSGTTQKVAVSATNKGKACAWTATSSDESILTVSPASGTASDTTLTITTLALGSATVTVTNSVSTALVKTIEVTVADYPNTNSAYTLTSANVYPLPGATNAYTNGAIRLTFDGDITLSDGGFVTIWKYADSSETLVDTINFIDESQVPVTATTINVGTQLARVDGSNLYLTPHFGVLEANTTYYVAIPEGVITTGSEAAKINGVSFTGLSASYDATNGWFFTTGSAPSLSAGTPITVDSSESSTADFRSVQAALSTVANDSSLNVATNTFTINLAAGDYYEFIYYKGKANFKIVGQGDTRADTVIRYVNCNDMNGGTHYRAVFYYGGGSDLWLSNLTIKNLTERKTKYISTVEASSASQAEAIYFANAGDSSTALATGALAVNNCAFYSHQDTIQTTGKNWFYDCYIEGDVDFLWGTAQTALFENCELVSSLDPNRGTTSTQHLIVARTGKKAATAIGKGYVVKGGTLKIDSGVNCYLGRDAGSGDFYDQAAVVDTEIKGDGTLGIDEDKNSSTYGKSILWDISTYLSLTDYEEHVGWKVYGLTKDGSAVDTTYTATDESTTPKKYTKVLSSDTYTAEYTTRAQILDRVYNTSTHAYADDTAAAWDTISVFKLADLVTAFGAE